MSTKQYTLSLLMAIGTLASITTLSADVVVDNMNGAGNRALSNGVWFATQDGKSEGDITAENSNIIYPPLARAFSFYDLSQAPVPETGKVAYLSGAIGPRVDFPFLGFGFNLTTLKDTMDLSGVTHLAFRARGAGNWGFKIKSSLANQIAVQMGKEPGQIDWRYDFTSELDSVLFKWIVVTPGDLQPTTAAFHQALQAAGKTSLDGMTRVYQVQWTTVGYKSADGGAQAWVQVDDMIMLGSVDRVGASSAVPTAEQKTAIMGGAGSSAQRKRSWTKGFQGLNPSSPFRVEYYSLLGHKLGSRLSNLQTPQNLGNGILIRKTNQDDRSHLVPVLVE